MPNWYEQERLKPRIHNQELEYLNNKTKISLKNPYILIIWNKNQKYMVRTL